jgi:prepilin-type N-terminal cleavage/methylation domain-containing protein
MESFRPHRGVTLIELLVVLAIIGILMVVVITSQTSFNKTLILANTAYDVALTVRSTETLGLASPATGYGLDFKKASPGQFVLFADTWPSASATSCHPSTGANTPGVRPGDCAYNVNNDQTLNTYTIGNGITIKDFCAAQGSTWTCASSAVGGLTSLDIVFSRPDVRAFITVNGAQSNAYTAACVSFTSRQGGVRAISVSRSGEITGNAVSCPTP